MDPFRIFEEWYEEAKASEPRDANAMVVATATSDGAPSARYVLFKDHGPGGFVFYTNLESRKGLELATNPRAAIAIHWKSTYKQVRIEGPVEQVDDATADAYFASRGRDKQLAASASQQSRELPSEDLFEARIEELDKLDVLSRPAHWSGLRVIPERIELWEGNESRTHHRRLFVKQEDGSWTESLLYP
ncbi:pyridoxamine 5'-phosphate oxidase [Sphingomicrobium sediminis]|uniref:Pyridoxamine 5'-phosphate oxidase n=1 Tax=Sphingomicrobium sediminis TaxID=2950949 RepID=A0A9X2J2N5_9SPHN|nr:pyridoxamine 5'-phosphate oxidase [Sphingomicrobium sediminis]MCM8558488.1 pyridoxamine 5'-phosphate oxidase [Sphingomicrobium sediminis]